MSCPYMPHPASGCTPGGDKCPAKAASGKPVETVSNGAPVGDNLNSLTAGPNGPVLLQDFRLIDTLAHFDRERTPERVVHAKGAGAFGYFVCTKDCSHWTKAHFLGEAGRSTPVLMRFSTVAGERGSADTVRDPRGFAVKFYTEEGNYDMVGNNTPVFFIRDPVLFPHFIHSQKRNPKNNLKDPNMVFDFFSKRPEALHQITILYSDRGLPDGYRHMNGYSSHTFRFVNAEGKTSWFKWHFKVVGGCKNLTPERAAALSAGDPDYATRDLYDHIEAGNTVEWRACLQVMTEEQAKTYRINPFDVTKVWPHGDFPLIEVGRLVLNKNASNYFAQIEQAAFSPSHLVPGIEPSPDKMLQGRLFSYPDTHRHRLGANYQQLIVNCPFRTRVINHHRDGPATFGENGGGAVNYGPSSETTALTVDPTAVEAPIAVDGPGGHYAVPTPNDRGNFEQPGNLFHVVLSADEQQRLCTQLAGHLAAAKPCYQVQMIELLRKCHESYGAGVETELRKIQLKARM